MAKLEELKKLSPQERLAKLRELEESRRREIAEAREMLNDTVRELVAEGEREQIPIDQLRAVDESTLLTTEERDLFRTKRFTGAKSPSAESAEKPDAIKRAAEELEERVVGAPRLAKVKQYGSELSKVMDQLSEDYHNPHLVKDAVEIITKAAYNPDLSEEERWKIHADSKSLEAAFEQIGIASTEMKYLANATQKFIDRSKLYRT